LANDRTTRLLTGLPMRVSIIVLTTVVYALSAVLADVLYGSDYAVPPNFWYMVSAFPVFGMLLADLAACWGIYRLRFATWELGTMVVLLAVLATVRLSLVFPVSGHVLLLAYLVLRRVLVRFLPNRLRWTELGIAAILYIVVVYLKVFCWGDLLTPAAGTGVGLLLAAISWGLLRWRGRLPGPDAVGARSL
jgi:hypothetical protein